MSLLDDMDVLTRVADDLAECYAPRAEEMPAITRLFAKNLLTILPPGDRYRLSRAGRAMFGMSAMSARELQSALAREYGA